MKQCNGQWIASHYRGKSKVKGHCRKSIQTLLNDNENKSKELKSILYASQRQLNDIKEQIQSLSDPNVKQRLSQYKTLSDMKQSNDPVVQSILPYLIPKSSELLLNLESIQKRLEQQLKYDHLYQYQPIHPILYELMNVIHSLRSSMEASIQQLEQIQMKPTGMNDSLIELKNKFQEQTDLLHQKMEIIHQKDLQMEQIQKELDQHLKDKLEWEKKHKDLIQQKDETQQKLQEAKNDENIKELKNARKELNDIKKKLHDAEFSLLQKNNEFHVIQSEKDRLEQELVQWKETQLERNSELSGSKQKIELLQKDLSEAQADLSKRILENKGLHDQAEQDKLSIVEKQNMINGLIQEKQLLNDTLLQKENKLKELRQQSESSQQNSLQEQMTQIQHEKEQIEKQLRDRQIVLESTIEQKDAELRRIQDELKRIQDESHQLQQLQKNDSLRIEKEGSIQRQLEEKTKEIEQLKEKLHQLQEEEKSRNETVNESLRTEKEVFDKIQKKMEEKTKEMERIQDQLHQLQQEDKNTNESLRVEKEGSNLIRKQLEEKTKEMERLQDEVNKTKQNVTEHQKQIQTQASELQNQQSEMEKKIQELSQLRSELSQSKETHRELMSTSQQSKNELADLNIQIATKLAEMKQKDLQIKDLEDQLSSKKTEMDQLKAQKEEKEQKLSELTSQFDEYKRTHSDLTNQLKENQDSSLRQKEERINELQSLLDQVQKKESEQMQTISTLQQRITDQAKQMDDVKSLLSQKESELKTKSDELKDQKDSEIQNLKQQLDELSKSSDSLKAEKTKLVSELSTQVSDLQLKLDNVSSELKQKVDELLLERKKQEELNNNLIQAKGSSDELSSIKQDLAQSMENVTQKTVEIDRLTQKLSTLEDIQKKSMEEKTNILSQLSTQTDTISQLNSELKQKQSELETEKKSQSSRSEDVSQKESEISKLTQQLKDLETKNNDLIKKCNELEKKSEELAQLQLKDSDQKQEMEKLKEMDQKNQDMIRQLNSEKEKLVFEQNAQLEKVQSTLKLKETELEQERSNQAELTKKLMDANGSKDGLQQIEQDLVKQKQKMDEKETELGVLNKQMEDLKSEHKLALELKTNENDKKITDKQVEIDKLKTKLSELQQKSSFTYQEKIDELAKKNEELAKKTEELAQLIFKTQIKDSEQNAKMEELKSLLKLKETELEQEKTNQGELTKKLMDANGSKDGLQKMEEELVKQNAKTEEKNTEIEKLKEQIIGLESKSSQLDMIKSSLNEANAKIRESETNSTRSANEITKLTDEIKALKDEIKALKTQASSISNKLNDELDLELRGVKIELNDANSKLNVANSQLDIANSNLGQLTEQRKGLRNQIDELNIQIKQLKSQEKNTTVSLSEIQSKLEEKETETQQLKETVQKELSEKQKQKEELEVAQTKLKESESKLSQVQMDLDEKTSLLNAKDTELSTLTVQIKSDNVNMVPLAQLDEVKAERDNLIKERDQLKDTKIKIEQDMNAILEKEKKSNSEKEKEWTEKINSLNKDIIDHKKIKDDLVKQNSDLKSDIEMTKNMLQQTTDMILNTTSLLDGTAYEMIATKLKKNISNIKDKVSLDPITELDLPIVTPSKSISVSSSVESEKFSVPMESKDSRQLGSNINDELVGFEAKESVSEQEDITTINTQYVHLLEYLLDLEKDYKKVVQTSNVMILQMQEMIQWDQTDKDNNTDTFNIYLFTATLLFQMTRTLVRMPTVLRILSMEGKNDKISPQLIDNRNTLLKSIKIIVPDANEELKTFLYSKDSDIQTRFLQYINKEVRIDILSYYLLEFMDLIPDLSTQVNEAKELFIYFDRVVKLIIKKLILVFKAVKGNTSSILDSLINGSSINTISAHIKYNPVITLVKIRMDGLEHINARFKCYPISKKDNKSEKNVMRLQYCDFDYRYGANEMEADQIDEKGNEIKGEVSKYGNSEWKANGFPFYYTKKDKDVVQTIDMDSEEKDGIPYNSDMYFGPFSRIYTPDMTNSDIVNDSIFRESIEQKLRNGTPVCIIGYGASGSGKTSTLVYFKPDTGKGQDGILSVLSNNLSDLFDTVNIKVYEFEGNITKEYDANGKVIMEYDPVADYLIRKYPPETYPVTVQSKKNSETFNILPNIKKSFIEQRMNEQERLDNLDPTNPMNSSFEYKYDKAWVKTSSKYSSYEVSQEIYEQLSGPKYEKDSKYYQILPETTVDSKGPILMASDIVDFMDNKRSVAATANNPVSSRSHVIIFITYSSSKKDREPSTLVLCDFAGVENKFDCSSASTLSKLGTIPIKGSETPYYESKTNDLKIAKYNESLSSLVQKQILSMCSDDVLRKNVEWLMKEILSNPLPLKETKNQPGISAEIAEKLCQSTYGMTYKPTVFIQAVSEFKQCYDKIKIQLTEYKKELDKMLNPSGSLLSEWNTGKNDTNYKPTIKLIEKLVGEIKYSNQMKIIPFSDIPIENFPNKLNNSPPIKSLSNKLLQEILTPLPPKITFGDLSTNINILTGNNLTNYLKSLYSIIPRFGAELFTEYKDDSDRKLNLQLIQYIFEYGMIGVNSIADATPTFMVDICKNRVGEGLYINDSLLQLRKFISKVVQKQSSGFPAFTDQCAPIQCNPSYMNCFGINNYESKETDTVDSSLAKQIQKVPRSAEMTFCILCVVNLSRTSANNPPVSPYINITHLTAEYERLQTVQSQFFMKKEDLKDLIKIELKTELKNEIKTKLNPDSIDQNGKFLSNALQINPKVLNELIYHPLLMRPLDETLIFNIKKQCKELLTSKNGIKQPGYLEKMKTLIDLIYNTNAITTIGTLEFTDTMAKFGTNSVTCTMKYQPITKKQTNVFFEKMNGSMTDSVSSGLERLKKRNKLADYDVVENEPSIFDQMLPFSTRTSQGKMSKGELPFLEEKKVEVVVPKVVEVVKLLPPGKDTKGDVESKIIAYIKQEDPRFDFKSQKEYFMPAKPKASKYKKNRDGVWQVIY